MIHRELGVRSRIRGKVRIRVRFREVGPVHPYYPRLMMLSDVCISYVLALAKKNGSPLVVAKKTISI